MRSEASAWDWMAKAIEVVAERIVRAAEGELGPGDGRRVEFSGLQALVVDTQRAAEHGCGVHDDDGRAAGLRVHVHQAFESHVEAAFFSRFADCRRRE